MTKLLAVFSLILCAAVGTIGEDIDCSNVYTCDRAKPGNFVSRGMTLRCNPVGDDSLANICNFYPFKDCPPCIKREQLCDKYFQCNSGDLNKVTIEGIDIDCPPNFSCNNGGDDFECSPCRRAKCPNPRPWDCLDESTAVQNGQKIPCSDNSICNAENVAPCNQPCIPRDPNAQNYITLLRKFSISAAQRRN